MFTSFLKAMATDVPIGAAAVRNLKSVVTLFRLSDAAAAKFLEAAATDLQRHPSVLGMRSALCAQPSLRCFLVASSPLFCEPVPPVLSVNYI